MTGIRGIVCAGQGQGRSFTRLDWVRRQFRDKLGFDPYPGTLNLQIDAKVDAVWIVPQVPGIGRMWSN
ncbi:MAG TPA: DUF120 domain-containing protein [Anaerolineae bacterium]